MAPTIGGATVPLTAPAAIGGGALPFLAETYAEQQGDVGQRLAATEQYTREHPVQTTVAAAAPFVAEAAAPMLKAGGKKLIDAGNRGLARVGLGPAEVARIRSLGLEKLTDFGAKMRSAGLDKPRDILQRFSPTDARRISDNAADIIGGQEGHISQLQDELLGTKGFGQNEIDPTQLTQQLRTAVRPNSAEITTPETQRAMERQAQRFEWTPETPEPYTVARAVQDKQDIGKRLFDKKQRLLQGHPGEDEARGISWKWLKDRVQQEIDKAAQSGQLAPKQVENYRQASQDFNIAADVQVDAARKAEQELRQQASLLKGGPRLAQAATQGTQYNLGRLLQGTGNRTPMVSHGAVGAMSPAQQQDKNDQMKQELFEPWYNKLVGADQ